MANVHGRRKAIIFLSEGIDYDTTDLINSTYGSNVLDGIRDAIGAATRSNASIYAVDPRGLTGLGDEDIEIASLPMRDADVGTVFNVGSSFRTTLQLAQDSLRTLADETGGFASVNSNDFARAFDRVVSDNSSYYVLGYYPAVERRDGKFHRIEVRLTRPNLTVRARKGYLAPRGRPAPPKTIDANSISTPLREVLVNPIAVPGLPMALSVAAFRGTKQDASLVLSLFLAGSGLSFEERDGVYLDNIEVSTMALDQDGNSKGGDRHTLDLKLKPDTYQVVRRNGFRLLSRFEVPAGRYQIRVAARERASANAGSVIYDLEVPDFTKEKLAMSGLVLTATSARYTPTARPDEALKPVLPGPPITHRQFLQDEELALFVDVYDNVPGTPHRVDITTTIRTTEGREVFKTEDERSSEELQGGRGAYGHSGTIPLKDLAPGLYVLRVEARSRLQDTPAVAREVQFTIVGGQPTAGAGGGPGGR
jgi:hypothetical protein